MAASLQQQRWGFWMDNSQMVIVRSVLGVVGEMRAEHVDQSRHSMSIDFAELIDRVPDILRRECYFINQCRSLHVLLSITFDLGLGPLLRCKLLGPSPPHHAIVSQPHGGDRAVATTFARWHSISSFSSPHLPNLIRHCRHS